VGGRTFESLNENQVRTMRKCHTAVTMTNPRENLGYPENPDKTPEMAE
jgi:hypothetical protein